MPARLSAALWVASLVLLACVPCWPVAVASVVTGLIDLAHALAPLVGSRSVLADRLEKVEARVARVSNKVGIGTS